MNRFLQYATDEFSYSKNEKLHFVIRRHWIIDLLVFFRWIIASFGIITIAFLAFDYLGGIYMSPNFLLLAFFSAIYIIIITISSVITWLNHAFDVIFVTNDRVIDISQVDFFHKNIQETRLSNIQDVTGDIKGVFNTIFSIGTIHIRTSNHLADFSISLVKEPQKSSRKIFDLVRSAVKLENTDDTKKTCDISNAPKK